MEGRPEPPPDQYPEVFIEGVNKDYFAAYGVQLLRGRTFNNADMGERPKVVIINDSMAQHFWPNENPIGQRISNPREKDWQEVVGVVRDMKSPGSLGETLYALPNLCTTGPVGSRFYLHCAAH